MQPIIDAFLTKLSPEKLFINRHQAHDTINCFYSNMWKNIRTVIEQSPLPRVRNLVPPEFEEMFISGSAVEGANVARLFSDDPETSTEIEVDVMYVMGEIDEHGESMFQYHDENNVFLHVILPESERQMICQMLSSTPQDEVMQRVITEKGGLFYLNSSSIKEFLTTFKPIFNAFMQNMTPRESYPVTSMAERQTVLRHATEVMSRSVYEMIPPGPPVEEATGAAVKCSTFYRDPSTSSASAIQCAAVTAEKDEMERQAIAAVRELLNGVGKISSDCLRRLKQSEDELVAARKPDSGVSLQEQAARAKDYIRMGIYIVNRLISIKDEYSRIFGDFWGITLEQLLGSRQALNDIALGGLEGYIRRLSALDNQDVKSDETASATVVECETEAAVKQTLAEIESKFVAGSAMYTAFAKELLQFIQCRQAMEVTEASNKKIRETGIWNGLDKFMGKYSIDFVPCNRLSFWPSVAFEWLTRDREWPDGRTIESIANSGVHMVGKKFCHADIDWRLSFSAAEISLAKLWTPDQLFIYFIFKSLYYKFINSSKSPIKEMIYRREGNLTNATSTSRSASSKRKFLTSYVIKTTMMRVNECFPQSWWSVENAADCLSVLLTALRSAVENRCVEHYFVPSVNIIDGIPDDVIMSAVAAIDEILANPEHAARQLEPHFEAVLSFLDDGKHMQQRITIASQSINRIVDIYSQK